LYAYDRVKQALCLGINRDQASREAILVRRKRGALSILGVCSAIDNFPDPRDHEQGAYTGALLNTMDKIRAVLVRACHQQ
jgi:hypothetical protein